MLLALSAQSARGDALNFFNNWFVTGNVAVAGASLANSASAPATINMTGVSCTAGTGPATAVVPCSTPGAVPGYPIAAFLYWQAVESTATPAAASLSFDNGAVTGHVIGSDTSSACWVAAPSQRLRVYRADVLRFLPLDPATHLRRANGAHTVQLASYAGVLAAEGASLVVIYRVVAPGNPAIAPLRSIVIYDGAYTLSDKQPSMTQKIFGFYQASTSPAATMTHIAGNGGPAFQETLKVNGATPTGVSATRPFIGAQGPGWDNLTFGIDMNANASSTETKVVEAGGASDCISWGAVITAVNVRDSDGDGLLDIWEKNGMHRNTQVSPATFGGCADYPLEPCVNLPAMGAVNGNVDVFLQLDWMHGYGDGHGGVDGSGSHSHIPKLDALSAVAKAFLAHRIYLHFDVGNTYQGLGLPYIIPYTKDSYGNLLAQGGSDIDESTLVCQDTASHTCVYKNSYPVLSFKLGFNSIKDGNHLLNIPAHFAPIRKDVFHYGLFAHALAGPFTATGTPAGSDPKSISGIGDRPGGDLLITLGLWRSDIGANDMVGSTLVQAGTLMHELGHNLGLSHAGWSSTPNCAPNYPSVMSYLYQTRGLTDSRGVEQIDYSSGLLAGLTESSMSAGTPLGASPYRVRYYGPFNSSTNSPGQIAKRHCDGTDILDGAQEVRMEAPAPGTPDWSNGLAAQLGTTFPLDVNFDGALESLSDRPDWSSLNFQQVGSRGNFGSISTGSLATDAGSLATDAGSLATDAGSLATDAGSLATDAGSLATDAGSLATDAGSLATDAGDEDYDTHILSTTDRIPSAQQCAGCGLKAVNTIDSIALSWTPPDTGTIQSYNIYRCAGAGCAPKPPALVAGYAPPSKTAPTFTDSVNDFVNAGASCPTTPTVNTCYNTVYTYSVTAVSTAGTESPYSDPSTPTEVTHLFVVADSQSIVYGSPNPAPTFKVYGDVAGSLDVTKVSCSYSGTPRNAGTYPVSCSGPATTSPTDGVSYDKPYLTYPVGSLTINPRPITVTAAASSKTYDGNTSSTATPAITSGALAYSDTATWSETYDNRNAGTTHTMTPSGVVSDGNGGNNYKVTFATIATGVITPLPITVTAAASSKTYDGNTSSTATPTITSGGLISPDTATWSETYDNANAGTTHTMTPRGVVNDGNGGNNYAVTFLTISTGVILKANPTVAVTGYSVTYDGNPHTATGSVTGVKGESLTGLDLSGTTHTAAGTYSDPWTFTDTTGNYNNASGTVTDSIAKANATIVVTPYSVTYDGAAHTASGTATGVKGELLAGLDLSATTHTSAGTYSDAWTFTDSTGNYKPASGSVTDVIRGFTATGSLNVPRSFHAAALLPNGKVLVAGGFDASGNPLSSAEVYDPASGAFAMTGNNMPNKSAGGTATLLGSGKVLVVGGGNASVSLYDPSSNSFTSAGGLGTQRTNHTAVLLGNGKVLIAGGSNGSGSTQNSAQLFDPATGTFTATGNMTAAREFHTATVLPDGSVLIAGGRTAVNKGYTYLSSAEIYDPATGVFTSAGSSMSAARYGHTAALYGGKVLIAGGANSAGVSAADVYDPATGTFSPTGPLGAARQYATATPISTGVLVAGGLQGTTALQSTERYQGGGFAPFASMTAPHAAHTATVLANGSVLIVGGTGAAGVSIATAELLK